MSSELVDLPAETSPADTDILYIVTDPAGTPADAKVTMANLLAGAVRTTGNETVAGVKTFSSDPLIPDEAYGAGWNGVLEPPTKNAVYDKVETLAPLVSPTFTGLPVAPQWKATGVTGANTTPLTLSGANASGAPASGAHVKGEIAGDDTGKLWYCTVAGTPGTWVEVGGGAGSGDVATDTIWNTKGDLAAATGVDAAAVLAAAANGGLLTTDSGETTGLKYITRATLAADAAFTAAFASLAKLPKPYYANGSGSGDHTTTSTSFADVAAAYSLTVPSAAGDVLEIAMVATLSHSTTAYVVLSANVSGTGDVPQSMLQSVDTNSHSITFKYFHVVQSGDISGGNVTVKPRWKTNTGTATMFNESASLQRRPTFSVVNWKQ